MMTCVIACLNYHLDGYEIIALGVSKHLCKEATVSISQNLPAIVTTEAVTGDMAVLPWLLFVCCMGRREKRSVARV